MTAAGTCVVLTAAALATIVIAALHVPGIARVLLIAQAAYWSLSYIARPVVVLWVQPVPGFADNIADPRLAGIGYDHGVAEVLGPVVFGLWVYAAVVVAYATWSRGRADAGDARGLDTHLVPTLVAVYALGMLGRAAAYLTGSAGSAGEVESTNPILSIVAALATIGVLGLIIYFRSPDRTVTAATLGVLLGGELLWTVAIQSKSPIMGAALAVAVRFALAGWTRRRVAGVVTIAVVGVAGFGWLQSLKETAGARAASAVIDAQYPAFVQPFLSVLRRFDLLEAATDAYYMGGRAWLTVGEVLRHAAESLVPAQVLGSEKFHSGTAWATEVRGSSVDMTRVSVSLAEGNINEGYVLGGHSGVVLGVLFVFGLLLVTVRALQARHVVPVTLGLALTASPVLFERGVLGGMELLGKSLQLAVLVWLIDLTVRELRARTAGPPGPAGRRDDVGIPAGTRARESSDGTR